jgi:glutathione synthase/RimK-type ligase-like ATP-grasp enzyme
MCKVDFLDTHWKDQVVLYTSSEEYGLYYKNFIEDVVYGLEQVGARLIPGALFLRANNNKVFMEILRQTKLPAELQTIDSYFFGTLEELEQAIQAGKVACPCVVKKAAGAMSRGVFLAKNEDELRKLSRKVSYTRQAKVSLKERVRAHKHQGYKPESDFQGKFVIQPFISELKNDWKVLIYGEKYFVLRRNIKKKDFRASGSGYNYTSGSQAGFPEDMLDLIRQFYRALDLPNLSVDFAFDGEKGYIFEFQAIQFGTSTQYKSKDYYEYGAETWQLKENTYDQEQVYVHSIVEYLNRDYA